MQLPDSREPLTAAIFLQRSLHFGAFLTVRPVSVQRASSLGRTWPLMEAASWATGSMRSPSTPSKCAVYRDSWQLRDSPCSLHVAAAVADEACVMWHWFVLQACSGFTRCMQRQNALMRESSAVALHIAAGGL